MTSKTTKRYFKQEMNSSGALNNTIKSVDKAPSSKQPIIGPGDLRLKLELKSIHVHQNSMNSNEINRKPNIGSSVLLPRPLNFENNSKYLNAKRSGDTSYIVDSPIKDPKYFSKRIF